VNPTHGNARGDFGADIAALASSWLGLVLLMLASLGSAYLDLGVGNVLAGLVIATVKTGLVAWVFMQLRRASAMSRIAAAAGLATLLLLIALSLVDYKTRAQAPAAWQPAQQIAPALGVDSRR
jgi:cytochrome c oxidase subunit 4